MLLICRFDVSLEDEAVFARRARRALALLTRAEGCLGGGLGRSVDEPSRWVLSVRFASVVAYRRAMSPFDVREHVVPLLSEALADEPATYEVLAEGEDGTVTEHTSLLDVDARRG
ncbi:antibiotic biosynthesis monooxygenase [Pseudonocardia spinosispora]|uniref:antibiotic biosynthesis monooxygenase n=1 Tax=Pseudonocardia spinosispora TaxID=103441 RepID=UPI0004125FD3|nr:antibiotic biosynthesis monooxygenase [Pseudonocardia spinosispora]